MSKKIFKIDYLMNECLTDEDLHILLTTPSLKHSLIIAEFNEANYNIPNNDIISICKNNKDWMYEHYWTARQANSFFKKLVRVYKNIYNYSEGRCIAEAQWFTIMYGLTNIKRRKDKNIKLCQ